MLWPQTPESSATLTLPLPEPTLSWLCRLSLELRITPLHLSSFSGHLSTLSLVSPALVTQTAFWGRGSSQMEPLHKAGSMFSQRVQGTEKVRMFMPLFIFCKDCASQRLPYWPRLKTTLQRQVQGQVRSHMS